MMFNDVLRKVPSELFYFWTTAILRILSSHTIEHGAVNLAN